jgi:hypothetical protein
MGGEMRVPAAPPLHHWFSRAQEKELAFYAKRMHLPTLLLVPFAQLQLSTCTAQYLMSNERGWRTS